MLKRTLILMHFVALAGCLYAQTDQHFWANGKLKYERTCIADSCIAKEYYETGTIKAIHKDSACLKASNGYLLGVSYYTSQYCENGQLIMGYALNSITPVFVTKHYCDGKIEKKFWWTKFGYVGEYKFYSTKGILLEHGNYEQLPEKLTGWFQSERTGKWITYKEDGTKWSEVYYEKGKVITEK